MEARHLRGEELRVGLKAEFEREISEADITAFARLSGDENPLHIDAVYARQTNYQGRIVHGAFQVGLASAMVGMYLPGRDVLLGSVTSRFAAPLYYPSRVRVMGEISSWNVANSGGTVRVRVVEASSGIETASIYMGFTLHERNRSGADRTSQTAGSRAAGEERPLVAITGASGGIGEHLAAGLRQRYDLLALTRSHSLPDALLQAGGVETVRVDFDQPGWEMDLDVAAGGRPLYGMVHAAWPSAPTGGLLELEEGVLEQQVQFGALQTVRLAKYLYRNCPGPGRLIVIGTTSGTLSPLLSLAGYSLGKAAAEHAVRLLAPELARKQITVNAVLPPFVPVGINKAKTERVLLKETAKVPLGRLCTPEDILGAIEYLLSPQASFISGQKLALTGGQL